jgi:hypothetical protein
MKRAILLLFMTVGLSSCLKNVDYPNRPDVEFLGMYFNPNATSVIDSLGAVSFRFTDGDGNLGLDDGDSDGVFALGEPYYYNLFIRYFEKRNGQFEEFVTDPPFHVRFTRLSSAGVGNSLEGTMDVRIDARPGSPYDTVRYELYIVDRDLQHSDTIVTPDIVLSQLGF